MYSHEIAQLLHQMQEAPFADRPTRNATFYIQQGVHLAPIGKMNLDPCFQR
jgi:hypothetical protein